MQKSIDANRPGRGHCPELAAQVSLVLSRGTVGKLDAGTVISVAETSPAAAAGIKPGDHLMTFNNEAVPRTDTSAWISHFVDNNGEQPIRVLVRRDGVDEIRTITTVKACAIPVELITDSSPNAFTTGDRIVIHSSILRIAHTDAQLALVLGHELAHANLGHLDKQWLNQVLGWAGGAAIDAGLVLGGISTGGVFARQFARAGERGIQREFRTYRSRKVLEDVFTGKSRRNSNCQNVSGDACAFRTNAESRCRDRGQTAAQRSTGP
ncbi:MAG: M48 family metallopeptidase [Pseudolabrys sp.]